MRIKIAKKSFMQSFSIICTMLFSIVGYAQSSWSDYAPARNIIWEEKLEHQIGFLTDSLCQGRATGTRGGVEAATWIAREFDRIGLQKTDGSWFRSFKTENDLVGHNVLGIMSGSDKSGYGKYVIVGAHFDHIGILNGRHYPGADANASGVVAMINIAEMLASMKLTGKNYPYSVIFIGFDGYETDKAGSKEIWRMISEGEITDPSTGMPIRPDQISLMVNIDQIGASLSPLRPDRPDYIIMLGNNRLKPAKRDKLYTCNRLYITHLDLGFDYYGSENFTNIFYRLSDQRVFIDNGIPSILFTSGITMKTNKTHDNAASLDYPVFKKRILLMFHWIENMLF